jgi:hypothetical protein
MGLPQEFYSSEIAGFARHCIGSLPARQLPFGRNQGDYAANTAFHELNLPLRDTSFHVDKTIEQVQV